MLSIKISSKRKYKTLALKDEMDILKKLHSGKNLSKLAKEYGVGSVTLHHNKKKVEKIVEQLKMMDTAPGKPKTLRVGDYCQLFQ